MTLIGDQTTSLELTTSNITYTHVQSSAANTWTIVHSLGRFPSVTVVDSADTIVQGTVVYNTANQITVTFFQEGSAYAFSGKAHLN